MERTKDRGPNVPDKSIIVINILKRTRYASETDRSPSFSLGEQIWIAAAFRAICLVALKGCAMFQWSFRISAYQRVCNYTRISLYLRMYNMHAISKPVREISNNPAENAKRMRLAASHRQWRRRRWEQENERERDSIILRYVSPSWMVRGRIMSGIRATGISPIYCGSQWLTGYLHIAGGSRCDCSRLRLPVHISMWIPVPSPFDLLLAFMSRRDICISGIAAGEKSRRRRLWKIRAIPRELRKLMLRVVNNNWCDYDAVAASIMDITRRRYTDDALSLMRWCIIAGKRCTVINVQSILM